MQAAFDCKPHDMMKKTLYTAVYNRINTVLFKSKPMFVPETTEEYARSLNFRLMSAQHVGHKPRH